MAINKRKILESAQKYFQKGAYDKALKEYKALLEADPRDSNVRLKVGDIHSRLGQKDEAIAAYLKVAQQFMNDGFDAKAVALFKQITKIDPTRTDVCVSLAELYQRLGLASDAMAALQTAADAFHKAGRKREALELLRKMASFDPTNTTSRLKIADLLRQADLKDEAVAEYEEVVAELERQGEGETAIGVLERVLEIEPGRYSALIAISRALVAQRFPERAESFARRAVDLKPEAPEPLELLAEAVRALGRQDAIEDVYRRLAELHRARGDEDRAREIQQRFLSVAPLPGGAESPFGAPSESLSPGGVGGEDEILDESAFGFGATFGGVPNEKPAGAMPSAEETAVVEPAGESAMPLPPPDVEPMDPEQLLAEASVYLRYGKHERALASLEALLARDPANRAALEKLGEALLASGSPERAVEAFSEAAKLAADAGDEDSLEVLRVRIAALDEDAAERLAPAEERLAAAAAPGPHATAGDADADLELDLDVDVDADAELDLDAEPAAGGAAPPEAEEHEVEVEVSLPDISAAGLSPDVEEAPADTTGPGASGQEEDDFALDEAAEAFAAELSRGVEDDDEDETPAERPVATPAPPAAKPAAAPARPNGASSTTPQQIVEELEEADFYFHQGLFAEAEEVYRRVLLAAPNHPQAMLRLGEIAASRGEDPASGGESSPDLAPVRHGATDGDASDDAAALADDLLDLDDDFSGAGETSEAPDASALDLDRDETPTDEEESHAVSASDAAASDEIEIDVDLPAFEPASSGLRDDVSAREIAGAEAPSRPERAGATDPALSAALEAAGLAEQDAAGDAADPSDLTADADDAFAAAGEGEDASLGAEDALPDSPALADAADDDGALDLDGDLDGDAPAVAGSDETAREVSAPDEAPFDLAAELSDVFASANDDSASAGSGAPAGDDTFAAIFREFKKGVSKTLSEGDHETHYDLGIAYREMGLFEDAVGEFRVALESPTRRIDCLQMLGLCALDLKRPRDAVAHLEQALALPDVPLEQQTAIRFDLARALEAAGELARARDAYAAVADAEPDFQDVEERLARVVALLEGDASGEEAAPPARVESGETFESFDDLIAEAQADLTAEVAAVAPDDESPETVEPEPEPDPPAAGKGARGPARRRKISFG